MSYAESNEGRAGQVQRGAGFEYSYSLKLSTATTPTVTLTDADQRLVEFNAAGGPGTVFLPAQPDDWMEFEFAEQAGSAVALTVDGNGNTINGAAQLVLNAPGRCRVLRFVPAAGAVAAEWKIVGGSN